MDNIVMQMSKRLGDTAFLGINKIMIMSPKCNKYESNCKAKTFQGHLHLTIKEGRDLPNLDGSFLNRTDLSDPYVSVYTAIDGKPTCRLAKTRVIDNDLNPYWGECFKVILCHKFNSIMFAVMDEDKMTYDDKIGNKFISGEELASGNEIEGWFPIDGPRKKNGHIHLSIRFFPAVCEGISHEVPDVTFPMRTGCSVRLYQDAHTPAIPPLTNIKDRFGNPYNPPQCWVELSAALNNAKKLIYIVGWSVKVDIPLLRTGQRNQEELLGDLLKRKANEGCRVLILIWDEALSTEFYPPGILGTHDEATYNYFRGTKVKLFKCSRKKRKGKILDRLMVFTTYTHHQKCVIVDADAHINDAEGNNNFHQFSSCYSDLSEIEEKEKTKHRNKTKRRRLIAFQGGIDLTDGRWDTFEHPLYRTLFEEHKHDFYNHVINTNSTVGPREPWHDVHMLVEGKAVQDILTNFVERWRKSAPEHENLLVRLNNDEYDLDYEENGINDSDNDENSWNVQFFRSINSDSVMFDHDALKYLKSRKGRNYDDSIQQAYIHHIRNAKRFIYIENQYFMGSSHSWKVPMLKCSNLIPIEITTRIKQAIAKGEQFRVYILLPLHPEGDPTCSTIQEILHWQYRTLEMMYAKIGKAIRKSKLTKNAHPTDYLSFFCLGKCEHPSTLPANLATPANAITAKVRKSLRMMIYVHSKMAIFDDEYIILGSANINERSMAGHRDTEMAFGAYQPNLIQDGDVRTFRLALWAEHFGVHMEEHLYPSSLDCMKTMRHIGQSNISNYLKAVPMDDDSRLMIYPLYVEINGTLSNYPLFRTFPDTGGLVCGKSKFLVPNSLTT